MADRQHAYNHTSTLLRQQSRKDAAERRTAILHLIHRFLLDRNYLLSAEQLQAEARLSDTYELCDNIDLDIMLQEYQSYYWTKFQRAPKLLKRTASDTCGIGADGAVAAASKPKSALKMCKKATAQSAATSNSETKQPSTTNNATNANNDGADLSALKVDVLALSGSNQQGGTGRAVYDYDRDTTLMPPFVAFDLKSQSADFQTMYQQLRHDVVIPKGSNGNVRFENCIGLDGIVESLKEAVIYPHMYPELFRNEIEWKAILLYGPPGTGKTMLAKALANEPFAGPLLNVTSSTFTSKWRGESEKLVRVLFEMARNIYDDTDGTTTIFIDEIDSLAGVNNETNHEASRRFRSELLTQIDGIVAMGRRVFLLASSNNPWNIDEALLRRFEKRILVPLPNAAARAQILDRYLQSMSGRKVTANSKLSTSELERIAAITEGYSPSDLKIVCKEVQMLAVRDIIHKSGMAAAKPQHRAEISSQMDIKVQDIVRVVEERVKPACINHHRYTEWHSKFKAI